MILLHHKESELSRNLLAAMPSDGTTTVVDCTKGIPDNYTGPMSVSAFPSVVVDVPAYSETVPAYDTTDGGRLTGTEVQTVLAHQEVLRMPVSWDAVAQFNTWTAARAAQSPAE